MRCLTSQPLSTNSTASQSSTSWCSGVSPCEPRSLSDFDRPVPKSIFQSRLTNTRAVSGLSALVSHSAKSRRVRRRFSAALVSRKCGGRGSTISPDSSIQLPRANTRVTSGSSRCSVTRHSSARSSSAFLRRSSRRISCQFGLAAVHSSNDGLAFDRQLGKLRIAHREPQPARDPPRGPALGGDHDVHRVGRHGPVEDEHRPPHAPPRRARRPNRCGCWRRRSCTSPTSGPSRSASSAAKRTCRPPGAQLHLAQLEPSRSLRLRRASTSIISAVADRERLRRVHAQDRLVGLLLRVEVLGRRPNLTRRP